MKVKHFAGYGSVEAKKIGQRKEGELKTVVVRVRGNHERGLLCFDRYDFVRWLGKKVIKDLEDERCIVRYATNECYEIAEDGNDVETCTYYVTYAADKETAYRYR